jgi:predicted DCC family thiol-disulfide oxidoreductase YuxK
MEKHLLFYDGTCGFCMGWVQFVLRQDKNKRFFFAPLQGETAKRLLKEPPEDTLVLIENFETPTPRVSILGKGSFRILWLLGGWWRLLGWISFLPQFLYNWGYRLVANHRHFFPSPSQDSCPIPDEDERLRFLP